MMIRKVAYVFVLMFLSMAAAYANASFSTSQKVSVLTLNAPIGPAAAAYVSRGIAKSRKTRAEAILLQIDTPGGLSSSMRDIVKTILSSTVPVIAYVTPSGARAASAGTYILYASHIAAMAPGTNLGAATPVSLGASDNKKEKRSELSARDKKARNDSTAYIRSLAQLQGKNESWAIKAVENGDSLSAKEALALHVIDKISPSAMQLIKSLNGKVVHVKGVEQTLLLTHPKLIYLHPSWLNQILQVITNPSITYILLMIGIFALFFEMMNPGLIVPGVVGVAAILLSLYAFQLLPINYAGLFLIILGIICIVAEAFMPSYGALGLGGVISFVAGSFFLLDTDIPGFILPWQLIITVAGIMVFLIIALVQLLWRGSRRPVVSGVEGMIGQMGVIELDQKDLWVLIDGERWRVRSEKHLENNQSVRVCKVEGLTLVVE